MKLSKPLTIALGGLACGAVAVAATLTSGNDANLDVKVDNAPIDRTAPLPASYAPIVEDAMKSVVHVFTSQEMEMNNSLRGLFNHPMLRPYLDQLPETPMNRGTGSGVIVTPDGYILTNNHVVDGADSIRVRLPAQLDGKEYEAELVGTDPDTDVALLKIDGKDLPTVTLGNSEELLVGDRVFAVGNPFDVGQTVTSGIVSAIGRTNVGIVPYENFIQTDASINPGNSGGALLDVKGRLIGINTAILSRTGGNHGIGLAIPINMAFNVMQELVTDGKVARGFLGVSMTGLTQDVADFYGMARAQGVLISHVVGGSPAARGGIQAGDIVTQFNGQRVNNPRHLKSLVGQLPPGSDAQIVVNRNGQERDINVTLAELDEEALMGLSTQPGAPAPSQPEQEKLSDGKTPLAGLSLGKFDAANRPDAGYPEDLKGVIINTLHPDSPAAEKGLQEGDVIVEINHQPVDSVETAHAIAAKAGEGKVLVRVWRNGNYQFAVLEAPEE